ncbi:thioesterase family protein [Candidatus Bathyarchaeota archaeon]|nr:thioesterase family protein [Candidatus Bathyarchaeota archaeon]
MIYEKRNMRVLPDDTDAFGRLNWLAYVRYCEEGEAGLMDLLGFSVMRFYKGLKISFPRRAAVFEYFSPVSPDSLIDLETRVKRVGKTSFTLSHTFYKKNREEGERMVAAKAEITVVAFDEKTHQKTGLPIQLSKSLNQFHVQQTSMK